MTNFNQENSCANRCCISCCWALRFSSPTAWCPSLQRRARENCHHARPTRVHVGQLYANPATAADRRGVGRPDPGSGAAGSLITARRWRWAWTRTTSSSAAACSRRWNSSPMMSPLRPSRPTTELECLSAGASRFVSRGPSDSRSAKCFSIRRSTAKTLRETAAQLLAQLKQEGGKADISALGDSIMLDNAYDALPAARSGGYSAISSRRRWAGCRSANGKGRSNPLTVCIWCS